MVDFTSVLSKKTSEVEKPKPKPVGTYLSTVSGMPKQKSITVQGEEKGIISFSIKLMSPQEDVDQEDLANFGSDVTSWPPFNRDIWIDSPEGEWALRQFLTNTLGIEPGEGKNEKTLGEMCAEAPGKQLLATLKHRPFMNKQNEAEISTEIGATAKA